MLYVLFCINLPLCLRKVRKSYFNSSSSNSTRLLHINVQQMNLAGENSIDDVLMYIGQLALVKISKATFFNRNRHQLDCHKTLAFIQFH
jgi:hypothetical protein